MSVAESGQTTEGPRRGRRAVKNLVAIVASLAAIAWAGMSLRERVQPQARWARMLRSGNAEDRQNAAMAFGNLAEKGGGAPVEALTAALADDDATVRQATLVSLGRIAQTLAEAESGPAFAALVSGLKDRDPNVRLLAAMGLKRLTDAPPPPALLAALESDDSPTVRAESARALVGYRGSSDATIRAMIRGLGQADLVARAGVLRHAGDDDARPRVGSGPGRPSRHARPRRPSPGRQVAGEGRPPGLGGRAARWRRTWRNPTPSTAPGPRRATRRARPSWPWGGSPRARPGRARRSRRWSAP